jgi:hypothetical protein
VGLNRCHQRVQQRGAHGVGVRTAVQQRFHLTVGWQPDERPAAAAAAAAAVETALASSRLPACASSPHSTAALKA